ncbi:MAG: Uncharacterized protein AWT59_3308 [Candidatus Gallionella acididurans]|uniref:Uncharacterized protein n=1 Tax=Candidatus Gallionella acididurans TaxID=1796491 RepID=A0A139BPE7_9PROT|nr:MAG: Uncharacterized protein AWT59_3308 [Candidatus Gallionella acididurans]
MQGNNMRISINYFEGYPELESELAKYPKRVRAERMRLLASIGLTTLHNGRPIVPPATMQPSIPVSTPASTELKAGVANGKAIKNVFDQV